MSKVRFEELTPPELTAAREATSLVYVPLGTLEYHGWHLPVGLDTLHAYQLCLRAASRAASGPPECHECQQNQVLQGFAA